VSDKTYAERFGTPSRPDGCPVLIAAALTKVETENAALRELTSTLGAPNHINVPVEQWHELRADKERLDWIIGKAPYLFFKALRSDLSKGRDQIDAARKQQP